MEWILWLYLFNALFMLIIMIREVRRPAKALNWLAISLILPVIGFGLYLSTTNPVHIRRERLTSPRSEDTLPDSFGRSASVVAHALRHLTVHGIRKGRVEVLINGSETYEKLLESLRKAKKTIDLEYYIYRDDPIGKRITELLIDRADAGVQVRFMRDGWGSREFPRRQIIRMRDAGIKCRTIFPLRFPWFLSNWNYRDHCKIVTIDGKEAFTGGINVGYEYTGLKSNVGFWRDTHLRIEGKASDDLQTIFDVHWKIASPEWVKTKSRPNTKTDHTRSRKTAPSDRQALSESLTEWGTELGGIDDLETSRSTESFHKVHIQTIEGNPGIPTPVIREMYFICLTQATQTVDITTPYFVPDEDILMAIKTAVARGVRVRLLVPRHVNQKVVGPASRTYYGELLEAGVYIYQYDKGMLHAKQMIIDGEIAEIGAANWDMRSFRLNYEVCEIIYSTDVARDLTEQFEQDLADSVQFRMEYLLERSLPQRLIEQGARLLSPLL
ncbi:phospholipase D-like domain-containing protein [Tuberibacillus sp. Marseille-P3662]|uniref:phospholipase D-like domain-containing protein n=1 Tax=Tuberibacillus sp. Marseille-P3662 TaxID=1965358 RepID=UPI000A1CD96C|nr:phospholipase D-like domain-containing protein [Tuberibacillus sp. Marseille-P3662]